MMDFVKCNWAYFPYAGLVIFLTIMSLGESEIVGRKLSEFREQFFRILILAHRCLRQFLTKSSRRPKLTKHSPLPGIGYPGYSPLIMSAHFPIVAPDDRLEGTRYSTIRPDARLLDASS